MQTLRELGRRIEKTFRKVKNLNPVYSSLCILAGVGFTLCIVYSAPIVLTVATGIILFSFVVTTIIDSSTSKSNVDLNDIRVIEANIRANTLNLNLTPSIASISSSSQASIDLPPTYSSLSPKHSLSLDSPPYALKDKDKGLKQNSDITRS